MIIAGGADWYRFFGAGEELAQMAEQGSIIPGVITAFIALILCVWGIYAFAGAGLIRHLPWIKPILIAITAIYLLRGLGLFPILLFAPDTVDNFLIVSSAISLMIGIFHFSGVRMMIRESR